MLHQGRACTPWDPCQLPQAAGAPACHLQATPSHEPSCRATAHDARSSCLMSCLHPYCTPPSACADAWQEERRTHRALQEGRSAQRRLAKAWERVGEEPCSWGNALRQYRAWRAEAAPAPAARTPAASAKPVAPRAAAAAQSSAVGAPASAPTATRTKAAIGNDLAHIGGTGPKPQTTPCAARAPCGAPFAMVSAALDDPRRCKYLRNVNKTLAK